MILTGDKDAVKVRNKNNFFYYVKKLLCVIFQAFMNLSLDQVKLILGLLVHLNGLNNVIYWLLMEKCILFYDYAHILCNYFMVLDEYVHLIVSGTHYLGFILWLELLSTISTSFLHMCRCRKVSTSKIK